MTDHQRYRKRVGGKDGTEGSATVLLVEDDPDARGLLEDLLTDQGYAVETAANGADAILALDEKDPPCVMLVDLLMPGVVGQELLEFLESEERFSSIAVGIVSGSPELAPKGYPLFPKPLNLPPLLDFIREGIERNQRARSQQRA